ncbi:MAG: beta-propeller fold lactonase family protein [Alphaproteobacteria bacterium]|nr:beta-propeller fold lactonase family protein [Alphaproteobacteria bacterium]
MKTILTSGCAMAAILVGTLGVRAELAVSANDGKQLRKGDAIAYVEPDSISVLDITAHGVRRLGSVAAPACMIGSPTAVALSHDSRFAIVTACQKLDGTELVANDTASVVDLRTPANPRIVQTVHTGNRPGGVSISPDGRLALIANSADNSISVFTIAGMHLTPAGTVALPEKSGPSDVVFTPDGKTAIAVGRGDSHLMILSVNGTQVRYTGRAFQPGINPYGAVVTHDGKYVINTDLGGALPAPGEKPAPGARRQGTISMSDIATGKLVDSEMVGPTPEHVAMSGDGKYIAVVVANGTAPVRSDPKWDKVKGLLEIYKVGDGTLTPAGRADTGHWCQGTTFSRDDSTLLLQCAGEREIEVYHYDGTRLTRVEGADIPMGARPGSIATAYSR